MASDLMANDLYADWTPQSIIEGYYALNYSNENPEKNVMLSEFLTNI